MTTNDTAIHTRALLVWLQISSWSARKYDKRATLTVNRDNNASDDAGRYNKMLLPGDATSYTALTTLLSSIRAWHYNETLAWSDEGWRLLPTANYMHYADQLRSHQAEVDRAVDAFVNDYPALRAQASMRLGGLYKPEDYPDVMDIRSKFAIGLNYMPVPTAGDIRVDLASEQIAMIEAEINGKSNSSVQTAMNDCWSRLHAVVAHAAERLADPSAIFRDSLIENVRECCNVLERMNVTNDPDLARMARETFNAVACNDPQTLRDSKHARQDTADKAKQILDQMSAFYSGS
jgi:hypothetical protein